MPDIVQRVERYRSGLELRCLIRFDATAEEACFQAVAQAARLTRHIDRSLSKGEGLEEEWLINSCAPAAMYLADRTSRKALSLVSASKAASLPQYKTVYASASVTNLPTRQLFYNNLGQLEKEVDPDGVTTLCTYNAKGEMQKTAVDLNLNGQVDLGGYDRITMVTNDVTTYGGKNVRRSQTYAYGTNSSSTPTLVSRTMTSTDGLKSWSTVKRDEATEVTTTNETVYLRDQGRRTNIVSYPDGTSVVNTLTNGRLASVLRRNTKGRVFNRIPYLTLRLCRALTAEQGIRTAAGVDGLCDRIFLSASAREQDDHLTYARESLLRAAEAREALALYRQIRLGGVVREVAEVPAISRLEICGIVRAEQGRLRVRNRIYERVFTAAWAGHQLEHSRSCVNPP